MHAELRGKLSMSSPSRQDRLEDTLTDGVFSTLRYLPRGVLAAWLRAMLPGRFHEHITQSAVDSARFDFWPTLPGGAEPDLTLRIGSLLVVIEAKYGSAFGTGWGKHQLAVEWHQALRIADADALAGPVVVAITDNLVEPADINVARGQLRDAELAAAGLSRDEAVIWCPWQSVAAVVDAANRDEWRPGDHALASDLLQLMRRRGVRFVYEGFEKADWWLLAAAADAATKRVYPTIAEFSKEVISRGADRGLLWGGTDSGAVWYESKRLSKTHRWHRHYIQIPLLHSGFGTRLSHHCALYVVFTFNQPMIRAGWWFEPKQKGSLASDGAKAAAWLRNLDPDFDVVDSTSWHRPTVAVDRQIIDGEWLQKRLAAGAWFRVERSFAPDAITSTAPVIDLICDLSSSLLADGSILDGLNADGILDRSQTPAVVTLTEPVGDEEEGDGGAGPDS